MISADFLVVFLRTLEYYAGILFLTTNRVALFDDAFKSRIHMSLYYPALDVGTALERLGPLVPTNVPAGVIYQASVANEYRANMREHEADLRR